MDEWQLLKLLSGIRAKMFNGESEKHKEVVNKLDELILKALSAIKTVEE